MTDPSDPAAELLIREQGRAGILTLNRPKALNALTHAMINGDGGTLSEMGGDAAHLRRDAGCRAGPRLLRRRRSAHAGGR